MDKWMAYQQVEEQINKFKTFTRARYFLEIVDRGFPKRNNFKLIEVNCTIFNSTTIEFTVLIFINKE
jgi:hypothetical protein